MSTAELIYEQVKDLPEPLAREVWDFVGYLRSKQEHGEVLDLMLAQQGGAVQSPLDLQSGCVDRISGS
ncbi:MAG: hypothetical protein ACREXW_07175 [Gammaproteobacteria bacterium]